MTSRATPVMLVVTSAAALAVSCGGAKRSSVSASSSRASPAAAAEGKQLAAEKGCGSCHSVDGSRGAGPTWKGLAGSKVQLTDGATVTANDGYLKESILRPDAKTVDGYPDGLMASVVHPGTVKPSQADALVAYIDSLR